MVKSIPNLVNGLGATFVFLIEETGRHAMSCGRQPGRLGTVPLGSFSSLELELMMPAVVRRRCIGSTESSRMRWWIGILDTRLQQKVWSPCVSIVAPQTQVGRLVGGCISRWSFCFRLMIKRSLGRRWEGTLRHIPTIGQEVSGRRSSSSLNWKSGLAVALSVAIRRRLAAFFILSLALLNDPLTVK